MKRKISIIKIKNNKFLDKNNKIKIILLVNLKILLLIIISIIIKDGFGLFFHGFVS